MEPNQSRNSVCLMGNYNSRQARLVKLNRIICDNFKEGDWFSVHDIIYLWSRTYPSSTPTSRELGKLLPALNLESERRPGESYLYYCMNDKKCLYEKKERDW